MHPVQQRRVSLQGIDPHRLSYDALASAAVRTGGSSTGSTSLDLPAATQAAHLRIFFPERSVTHRLPAAELEWLPQKRHMKETAGAYHPLIPDLQLQSVGF